MSVPRRWRHTAWLPAAALLAMCTGAGAQTWPLAASPASFLPNGPDAGAGRIEAVGDLDGDGVPDIGIGAPFDDADGMDAGRVYLFSGAGSLHRNYLPSEADAVIGGAAPSAMLGWSLAGIGDFDGDGIDDLAVGAPLQRTGDGSGTVYLFMGPMDDWDLPADVADADVTVEAVHLSSGLGATLGSGGDVTGDGLDDLWMGAPYTSDTEDDPLEVELDEHKLGRVHLLSGSLSPPSAVALATYPHLAISGVESGGMFGSSLAGGADISGDGVPDLCVGAPNARALGLESAGLVYCFVVLRPMPPGHHLSDTSRFAIQGAGERGLAGSSMDLVDFDGDGVHDLVVGAPYVQTLQVDGGSVAGFAGGEPLPVGDLAWDSGTFHIQATTPNGCLGYEVIGAGDLTGTGSEDILIAAPGADDDGFVTGLVYMLPGRPPAVAWPDGVDDLPIVLEGEFDQDRAGTHLAALGDRGAGLQWFMVGSVHSTHGGHEAGKSWLLHIKLDVDDDGDGYTELDGDCLDEDPDSFPGAEPVLDRDDDCDGWTEDAGDCDDADATVFPDGPEIEDGLDNDCDGEVDETGTAMDGDGDGWTEAQGDCDDTDDTVFPGAEEVCNDTDDNCNGVLDDDACSGDDDDSADPGTPPADDDGCDCAHSAGLPTPPWDWGALLAATMALWLRRFTFR